MTSSNIICSFCGKEQQDALAIVNGVSVNPKGQQTAGVICADSDDLARVYRFDLAQDSEMISPTIPILMSPGA